MGHTHYYSFNHDGFEAAGLPNVILAHVFRDMETVVRYASRRLTLELTKRAVHILLPLEDAPGMVDRLEINGHGKEGYETFVFPPETPSNYRPHEPESVFNRKGWRWSFVKTNRRPYDFAITACLAVAKHHLGDWVDVTSDGDASDWEAGVLLAIEALAIDIKNPIEDE